MSRGSHAPGHPGHTALAGARPEAFWLDDPERPEPNPPLTARLRADLVVVGGGYTGLWTALRSVARYPDASVVLLDAGHCGDAASGRNGGFCSASLTHGFANGLDRWPDEIDELDRLGALNLDAIEATVAELGIDCGFERTGELTLATAPHQVAELRDAAASARDHGRHVRFLDQGAVRARVDSPVALAGLYEPDTALVEPARLAWGLRRACLEAGVTIHENTPAVALRREGDGVVVRTPRGAVLGCRVALATNAFPSLVRRLRPFAVPVYDHVLMTEPLSPAQRSSIGWAGREGLADAANQFHYFRLTRDDRILWGGYDAVYHFGSQISPELEQSPTHDLLARQFVDTFPQLGGCASPTDGAA